MRNFQILTISCLLLGSLSACHTMQGAGEDIEDAGEAIKDTTERHTNY